MRRWQRWLATILALLLLAIAGGVAWLDSPSGHRFVVSQVMGLRPPSGLRIAIGRIDGSLYGKATLHEVVLSDPKGRFLSAPLVRLDWSPLGWVSRRLDIDELVIPQARLYRMPQFVKSGTSDGKLLPDFDLRIMRLEVGRLQVDQAVTGRADIFTLAGDADIRSGRAVIDFSARALRGRDRLLLALDSRPDDDRFDVDVTVNAPAGGLLAGLAGLKQDANLRLDGRGDWTRWDGRLLATLDGKSAVGLDLRARAGRYQADGAIAGDAIATQGLLARLTSPRLVISADGTFEDKLLSGRLEAASPAIRIALDGGYHLAGRGFDDLTVDVGVPQPKALLKDFDARGLVARARLNGPMPSARFEYLLRADLLRFGKTMVRQVRAAGDGRVGRDGTPTLIPIDLTARQVDGQGDMIASVLRNVRLRGTLQKLGNRITSTPMRLTSDKLDGRLVTLFDLGSGRYDLALGGNIRGLAIQGLGIVDLESRIKAVPGGRGGFAVSGRVAAVVRRLDNTFLRSLGGGLPRLQSDILLGPDGRLALRNLSVRAPLLTLRGEGVRYPDGKFRLTGSGTHATYGPLKLVLTGDISRPAVDLRLARPLDAAGLADVHAVLTPKPFGYAYTAEGGSRLGAFTSEGRILLPPRGAVTIAVDRLSVAGAEGKGQIMPVTGGLTGTIGFTGAATGTVALSVRSGVQVIAADLQVERARFGGATPTEIARGRLRGEIVLTEGGATIDMQANARGIQMGRLRISRFIGEAHLVGGRGTAKATLRGQRGRQFDLNVDAEIAPDEYRIGIAGTLDRRPISLSRKARLTRIEGGWALDPVTVRYRGGEAMIRRARFGSETTFDIALRNLSLSLLDIANADLGLGGVASGTLSYRQAKGGAPTGTAALRVAGLTRSGVTRTSTPIDAGINGTLTADRLALRAVMSQKGKIIGRAQALMTPLGTGGLVERLRAAPVRAQFRYVGPGDALWRLSVIEIVDLQGQVYLKADVRGTGADPIITGALMTKDAVLDSPITGMHVTGLRSAARFDGSRLVFSEIAGRTKGGGSIAGRGSIDLSLGEGVGIDLAFQAKQAELLDRDDIGATVTGPVTIRSGGVGGIIEGQFDVVKSRFMLGRAAAVAQIPELRVIEKNGRNDSYEPPPRGADWRLAIKANARNRLEVRGLGLSSEWRMNLDVSGSVANPVLVGRADLVRGSYDFAGRRFDLTTGTLRFDGSVPANPTLDITAQAQVSDLDATIRVTGTSSAPEIGFSSTPALPQDEVLSRILFGSSITQLSAPEALQLAAAVGSLSGGGGGGLDPINAVRRAAGLDRLRILPADPTTGQGTSIGVGKYLTRKIYVELITDGQGYSATRVEYQVTRWLSLLASISTLGRESITARVSRDY